MSSWLARGISGILMDAGTVTVPPPSDEAALEQALRAYIDGLVRELEQTRVDLAIAVRQVEALEARLDVRPDLLKRFDVR